MARLPLPVAAGAAAVPDARDEVAGEARRKAVTRSRTSSGRRLPPLSKQRKLRGGPAAVAVAAVPAAVEAAVVVAPLVAPRQRAMIARETPAPSVC